MQVAPGLRIRPRKLAITWGETGCEFGLEFWFGVHGSPSLFENCFFLQKPSFVKEDTTGGNGRGLSLSRVMDALMDAASDDLRGQLRNERAAREATEAALESAMKRIEELQARARMRTYAHVRRRLEAELASTQQLSAVLPP